jgi:hypothetical protein
MSLTSDIFLIIYGVAQHDGKSCKYEKQGK